MATLRIKKLEPLFLQSEVALGDANYVVVQCIQGRHLCMFVDRWQAVDCFTSYDFLYFVSLTELLYNSSGIELSHTAPLVVQKYGVQWQSNAISIINTGAECVKTICQGPIGLFDG